MAQLGRQRQRQKGLLLTGTGKQRRGEGRNVEGAGKSCHNSILERSMPFHSHVELQQVDAAAEAHHKSPNFES